MNTFSNTADHASDAISHARAAFLELPTQMMKLVDGARETERRGVDALLGRMGLQRRQSVFVPAMWFAAGAVVVGAAAFILAPTTGKQLRRRIAAFLDAEVDALAAQGEALERKIEETVKREVATTEKAPNGANHDTSR
jgi:hypothetical protein